MSDIKLVLPTGNAKGSQAWIDTRIVVIGAPGCGKSGLFANGDKTFYFDTEGTIGHLNVNKLPCRSMDEARAIYKALSDSVAAGVFPYDTIVVDTMDKLLSAVEEEVVTWGAEKFKSYADKKNIEITTVSDIPERAGWPRLAKNVTSFLDAIDSLPAAIVLITHPKMLSIEPPDAVKYDKESVALYPSIANIVLGRSHHNLHIKATWVGKTLKRVVHTRPDRAFEAKSHGSLIPDGWIWESESLADEYKFLRSLFT